MSTNNNSTTDFQRYFLVAVLVLLLLTLVFFIDPFIVDLLFAAMIVTAVFPAHKWIMNKIHFSRSLAAFVSMTLIIVIILLPFTLFGFFVVDEASDAYTVVSERIELIIDNGDVSNPSKLLEIIPFHDKIEDALDYLPISTADILNTAGDLVGSISSFLLSRTTDIIKSLSLFLVHIIVFFMSLFFLLREGDRLVLYIKSLVPLSKKYRQELFNKLNHLSYGIIYGIFGAAILQGILVGIGFSFAGIENAAFWGAIAALFSPVPYIGTAVIWVPVVIYMAITGHYLAAILLGIWCAVIVGLADNIVKPFLIGSSTKLNPMALLLVLLGGTFAFGIRGLLFGPLHIYQLEYKAILGKTEKIKPIVKKRKKT